MRYFGVFILYICSILPTVVVAQEVSIKAKAPKLVKTYKPFEFSIIIENAEEVDFPEMPSLKGLKVVAGPMQSTSMSFINGEKSSTKSLRYQLLATEAMNINVPSLFIVFENEEYITDPFTIVVEEGTTIDDEYNQNEEQLESLRDMNSFFGDFFNQQNPQREIKKKHKRKITHL